MDLTGESGWRLLNIWDALNDIELLKSCVRAVRYRRISDTEIRAALKVSSDPGRCGMQVSNMKPPILYVSAAVGFHSRVCA